jgi:Na+/melibiose symporter-like transporter
MSSIWRSRPSAKASVLALFRNGGFAIGLVMALFFCMLSSFYLTFAVYLQSGLHNSPLEAGLATLPFAVGYFANSLASSHVMQRLGVRALTLGFALGCNVALLMLAGVLTLALPVETQAASVSMPMQKVR